MFSIIRLKSGRYRLRRMYPLRRREIHIQAPLLKNLPFLQTDSRRRLCTSAFSCTMADSISSATSRLLFHHSPWKFSGQRIPLKNGGSCSLISESTVLRTICFRFAMTQQPSGVSQQPGSLRHTLNSLGDHVFVPTRCSSVIPSARNVF